MVAQVSAGSSLPPISTTSAAIPWDDLVELIAAGQVVPVVGDAALTVRVRGQWRLLCEVLAEELAKEARVESASAASLREVGAWALRSLPTGAIVKSKLRKIHDNLLQTLSNDDVGSTVRHICEIFPFIVTTSTTWLIETALEATRGRPPAVVLLGEGEANDLPKGFHPSTNGTLIHLFGRISRQLQFPLTDEDILESLRRLYEERPAELLDQLKDRNLLFIGVSFPDWLTRMFMRCLRKERLSDDRKTLKALADEAAQEVKLVLFLESLGPNVYVYHGDVAAFVEQLYSTWKREASSPERASLPPPTLDTDPVVFLSYSSADKTVADRVAELFRAQGLDVWYDRDRLKSGAHYEAEIQRGINRCVYFVPLISANTEKSDEGFFRREWDWAIKRLPDFTGTQRRLIVPLAVDDLDVRTLKNTPREFLDVTIQLAPAGKVPDDLLAELVKELRELRAGGGRA